MTDQNLPSPIQLGEAAIKTGKPQFAPRKGGGGGVRGSRYDTVLDKLPLLEKGNEEQYVEVQLKEGTDKDKAIGAIRVALKRRFGKEASKEYKVRTLADNNLGVFRV